MENINTFLSPQIDIYFTHLFTKYLLRITMLAIFLGHKDTAINKID